MRAAASGEGHCGLGGKVYLLDGVHVESVMCVIGKIGGMYSPRRGEEVDVVLFTKS
jgi:hypothetical protein